MKPSPLKTARKPKLELILSDQIKTYINDKVPQSLKALFTRAYKGNSKASTIKATCIECCGFEDYKTRINQCSSWKCPINPIRPYQHIVSK